MKPEDIRNYIDRDHNHYNGENCWFVERSDGKTQRYVPYDSTGMSRFILDGLKLGKVTVNGFEVVSYELVPDQLQWKFKE